MSAVIYIEGSMLGKNSKEMDVRCRKAFHKLLDPICPKRKPKLCACGSREQSFKDFKNSHMQRKANYVALLVDSEDPVEDLEKPWEHLRKWDKWTSQKARKTIRCSS